MAGGSVDRYEHLVGIWWHRSPFDRCVSFDLVVSRPYPEGILSHGSKSSCTRYPLRHVSSLVCVCVCVRALSHVWLCDPMDCSQQAPMSVEFCRQECWSGLPFPTPEYRPRDQTRVSWVGRQILLPLSHLGSSCFLHYQKRKGKKWQDDSGAPNGAKWLRKPC